MNPGYNEHGVPVGPAFSALPSPPPAHASVGGAPVQELIPIPPKLASWANGNELLHCLFKAKKSLGGSTILETIREGDDPSGAVTHIMVEAPSTETAKLARSLLQMSFKNEERISQTRDRRASLEDELYSAQGALAAGTVVEFAVKDDLLGLMIGKQGARIKRIQEEFDVKQIKVVGDEKVIIVGTDHKSAEEARRELEIFEETVDLDDLAFKGIEGDLRSLQEIKSTSNVLVASLLRAENAVRLIGTAQSMYQAKVLLEHQLGFARTQNDERDRERETRARLQQFTSSTGFPIAAGRGGRDGDRGGERRGPRTRGDRDRRGGQGNGNGRVVTPTKTVGPPKNARANAKPATTTAMASAAKEAVSEVKSAPTKRSTRGPGTGTGTGAGAATPPSPPAGDSRRKKSGGEKTAAASSGTKQTLADAKKAKEASAETKSGQARKSSAVEAVVTKGGKVRETDTSNNDKKKKKEKKKDEGVEKVTEAMQALSTKTTSPGLPTDDKKKRTRSKKASVTVSPEAATATTASGKNEKDSKKATDKKKSASVKKESTTNENGSISTTGAAAPKDAAAGSAEAPLAKRVRKRRGKSAAAAATETVDATLVE